MPGQPLPGRGVLARQQPVERLSGDLLTLLQPECGQASAQKYP